MEELISLLTLFGDRYINCDDEQAKADVLYNRDQMVEAYNAILHFAREVETNA